MFFQLENEAIMRHHFFQDIDRILNDDCFQYSKNAEPEHC